MAKNTFNQYVSVEEFCEQLGIGRNKAYAILNDPACRAVKIGNAWFIPYDTADRYVQEKINRKLMKEIWGGSVEDSEKESVG